MLTFITSISFLAGSSPSRDHCRRVAGITPACSSCTDLPL